MSSEPASQCATPTEEELDSIIENQLLNKNEKLFSVSDHLVRFLTKKLKDINDREMKTNPKVYRCFHCLEFIQTILTAQVLLIKKVVTSNPTIYGGLVEVENCKQIYLRTMLLLLQISRCTCNVIIFMNVCQNKRWTEQASYDSSTLTMKLEDCFRYLEKRISKLERILEEAVEYLRFGGKKWPINSRMSEVAIEYDGSSLLCVEEKLKMVKLVVSDCEERIWITCERINLTLRSIIKRRMVIKLMGGTIAVVGGLILSVFIVPADDKIPIYIRLSYFLGIIIAFVAVVLVIATILFKFPDKVPKDFDKFNTDRIKSTKEVDDFIISWEKFCGESLR
ncbi:hypothetical protein CHUAL_004189 [Chamberlinius hualienensis]